MVFNCCLVPTCNQVHDEELELERRRSKDKADYIRWRRARTKSLKSSAKSKRDKAKSKKKKKEEEEAELRILDERREDSEGEDDDDDDGEEVSRSTYRSEQKRRLEEGLAKVRITESPAAPEAASSETINAPKESQVIFRELQQDAQDDHTIKSEHLPGSSPRSILAESFYSDDSLDNAYLTFEVDYATSTPLFEALEINDWGNVLFFLRCGKFFPGTTPSHVSSETVVDSPERQVRTWVYQRDSSTGETMWRQLPLHAAICLMAPLVVVQRLVSQFYVGALLEGLQSV